MEWWSGVDFGKGWFKDMRSKYYLILVALVLYGGCYAIYLAKNSWVFVPNLLIVIFAVIWLLLCAGTAKLREMIDGYNNGNNINNNNGKAVHTK